MKGVGTPLNPLRVADMMMQLGKKHEIPNKSSIITKEVSPPHFFSANICNAIVAAVEMYHSLTCTCTLEKFEFANHEC